MAARQRQRDRVRCKMDEYPAEAREKLDAMLRDIRYTYQDIAEELTEAGWPITKSSVWRYASRTKAAGERLRLVAEQTRQLIQAVQDNHDVEATEVCSALLLDGLTRRLASAEEEFDSIPLDKAGRLLVQMQRSSVYKNRYKQERQKTIESLQDTMMQKLRDAVQDDDELLNRLSGMVEQAAREEAQKGDA